MVVDVFSRRLLNGLYPLGDVDFLKLLLLLNLLLEYEDGKQPEQGKSDYCFKQQPPAL